MNLEDMRNVATVVAAGVALLVFIFNVRSQSRNREIENIARFNEAHEKLFDANSYLLKNYDAIEKGTLKRNLSDAASEAQFHLMLLEIEKLALLANSGAVPRSTQVYMLGSYAPVIRKLMTPDESESMFWEVAREYLDDIARDAERYKKMSVAERTRFWR